MGKGKELVTCSNDDTSMPTRNPVAVVGKVCEQCFIIFITTCFSLSFILGCSDDYPTNASTWTVLSGTSFLRSIRLIGGEKVDIAHTVIPPW